jgi:hypothetical protein
MTFVLLTTLLFFILFYFTWKYQKFNELLSLTVCFSAIKNEQDEVKQQKLLFYISKKMMYFSFVNFVIFLVWLFPFITCYFIIGSEIFFNLFISWKSLIIMVFISIVFYLKFKVL